MTLNELKTERYQLKKQNKKQNNLYTCKQPLKMVHEKSESAWNNFGKFIYQLQSKTKKLIRKLERMLIKSYRQNMPLLFNQVSKK